MNTTIMAGQHVALLDDIVQLPVIWSLHGEVFALFNSFVLSNSSGEAIKAWDGYKEACKLDPSNALLEYMPILNANKNFGTSTTHATDAPVVESAKLK